MNSASAMKIQSALNSEGFAVDAVLYPSGLLAQVTGLRPVTNAIADADGNCAFCGKPHLKGDAVAAYKPKPSFNDGFNLANRTGNYLCGSCEATNLSCFQTKYGKALVCSEGMFPCAKNEDIAYWLLNPPEGPWYLHQSSRKRQHIVWKTPVNQSRELFFVQLNSLTLTLRRHAVVAQLEAAKTLVSAVNHARGLKSKATMLRTPFVNPCRNLDDPIFGLIRREVLELVSSSPSLQPHLNTLQAALPGEIWAMSATLYAEKSVKPEALDPAEDIAKDLAKSATAD